MYAEFAAFVAETPRLYVPSGVVEYEVTFIVAVPVPPFGSVSDWMESEPARPLGILAARLNVSFAQPPELLLVTDTE